MWKDHGPKIIIVALLVLIVSLPLLIKPSDAMLANATPTAGKLIIITPHNEQIRYELARGFNQWRQAHGEPPVAFDWRASGGTSDLRKTILSQFEALAEDGDENRGVGVDLFFGGGEYEHNKLKKGVEVERGGEKLRISATVPIDIDDATLREVYPNPTLGGEKLYDPEHYWLGAALSSFGIVYNRDVLDMLGAPEPTTWDDLAAPSYQGWVALADPAHSGSLAATYDTVLRRQGWTQGWATLRRVFANARYFASGSDKVPVDTSTGDAAAGMCIDFYGRYQAGAVQRAGEPSRVGYADPHVLVAGQTISTTATTADPISLLRGAPSAALATEFVHWVLSKDAQRLWQQKVGTPDGPEQFELRRMPVRADLYAADEKMSWTDPEIEPFATASPIPRGMPSFYGAVAPVTHAMAVDVLADLQEAWATINAEQDPRKKAAMLALFDAMPDDLTLHWPSDDLATNWAIILRNPDDARYPQVVATLDAFAKSVMARKPQMQKLEDKLRWTLFFRDNYRKIVSMGQ